MSAAETAGRAILGSMPMFRATLDRAAELHSMRANLIAMHGEVITDRVWASAVKFSTETPWSFDESLEAIMSEFIASGAVVSDWDELRRLRDRRAAERVLGIVTLVPMDRTVAQHAPNRADRRKRK